MLSLLSLLAGIYGKTLPSAETPVPNLLNVATTRARRRFYVIGDRNDWQHRALFSEVMDLLPPLDVQLPTSAQPELSATDHLTT